MTLRHWLTSLSLGAIAIAINSITAIAAETIFFVYGPLNLSLQISSLEAFAEDGTVNKNLRQYFELAEVKEEEKAKFRQALTTPVKVDPSLVSRLLNTEEGKRILNYFGNVINVKGGRNGKYILRGALIQAATESEGLNLINVLRKLPLDVQIDLQKALTYSEQVEIIVKGSYLLYEQVALLSDAEAAQTTPVDFAQLPELLDDYTNSLMLAFFEVYVSNNAEYRPYLQSSYAKYLSEEQEFKSYLITNASSKKLLEIIEKFIADYDLPPY